VKGKNEPADSLNGVSMEIAHVTFLEPMVSRNFREALPSNTSDLNVLLTKRD